MIQSVESMENRLGFEPEITAKVSRVGIKIREVPISYDPITLEEGRKIRIRDGRRAIDCDCIWKDRKGKL